MRAMSSAAWRRGVLSCVRDTLEAPIASTYAATGIMRSLFLATCFTPSVVVIFTSTTMPIVAHVTIVTAYGSRVTASNVCGLATTSDAVAASVVGPALRSCSVPVIIIGIPHINITHIFPKSNTVIPICRGAFRTWGTAWETATSFPMHVSVGIVASSLTYFKIIYKSREVIAERVRIMCTCSTYVCGPGRPVVQTMVS